MNKFMEAMKNSTNFTTTENGAVSHRTTCSDLYDMFAMGAAMRKRSDEDVILMWRKAYAEDPLYALKCLFYIRDAREGQGERRFFRLCINDLAKQDPDAVLRNIISIPFFGRWDDLYALVDTPLQDDAMKVIKAQLEIDVASETPSLLAKWMKSENTSSAESRRLGRITREYLGMSHKQYRKTLSILRTRINVLEKLMSENRWDEIQFDKIPSKAGLKYRNAFARHDLEREKAGEKTYAEFAKDESTTVNAGTLYPYEVVDKATKVWTRKGWYDYQLPPMDDTQRLMVNKYWDNLTDYFNGATFNGIAVVDTSGSMTGSSASCPINVAISLGMYCAEKAKGPFAGHYISFASRPQLIPVEGVDFCDKVMRIYKTNLCDNTNIEAVFDLILNNALKYNMSRDDLPQNIIIISDMEFDCGVGNYHWGYLPEDSKRETLTLMECIRKKWNSYGYDLPHLIYWNVDARQNNIPMLDDGPVSYVSGMSPTIFETIMSGKTGVDLMYEKLDSDRYSAIH